MIAAALVKLETLGFGTRYRFIAKVGRLGQKTGYDGQPVVILLLFDVALFAAPNDILTDHLWVAGGKWSKWAKRLAPSQRIVFNSLVGSSTAGYRGDRLDEAKWERKDFRLEQHSHLSILDGLTLNIDRLQAGRS